MTRKDIILANTNQRGGYNYITVGKTEYEDKSKSLGKETTS